MGDAIGHSRWRGTIRALDEVEGHGKVGGEANGWDGQAVVTVVKPGVEDLGEKEAGWCVGHAQPGGKAIVDQERVLIDAGKVGDAAQALGAEVVDVVEKARDIVEKAVVDGQLEDLGGEDPPVQVLSGGDEDGLVAAGAFLD